MRVLFLGLALFMTGCATGNCPDSGLGLGSTCGQTGNETSTTTTTSTSGSTTTDGNTTTTGTGQMYVANGASSTISRFASASTLNGDVLPTAILRGALTKLSSPAYLTFDTANNRLYVPNVGDNQILMFDGVSGLAENSPPTRFVSGGVTNLSRPVKVAIDFTRDQMYVANAGTSTILVFNAASTVQGPIAPSRTISGGNLTGLRSIVIDGANDRLYALSETSNSLLVYDSASTLNGSPPPSRVVSGANTKLSSPQDLWLDGDRLYITNGGDASFLRFETAATLSGAVAPAAQVIGGLSGLSRPGQIALNSSGNELYIADSGTNAILVFPGASTLSGGPSTSRRLTGTNTGINGPTGLALDLSR